MTRDKIIEAIGTIAQNLSDFGRRAEVGRYVYFAIVDAIPGLSDVLDGKAVIVPKEPTEEMQSALDDALFFDPPSRRPLPELTREVVEHLLAASPYRKEPEA